MVAVKKSPIGLAADTASPTSNGCSELAATVKNVNQCIKKIESPDSSVQRRLSPRLHTTPDGSKPGTEKLESPVSSIQRRVSPRLHCISNDKKTGFQKLESPISTTRRLSPRLHSIPDEVPGIQKHKSPVSPVQRRVSPRFHGSPNAKGSCTQKLQSPVSPVQQKASPRRCIIMDDKKLDIQNPESSVQQGVSPRLKHISGDKKPGIQKVEYLVCPLQRRVSPRLRSIPDDKKPHYGSHCKRKQDVSKDISSNKKTKVKPSAGGNTLDKREANAREEDTGDASDSVEDESDGIAKWLAPFSLIHKHGISLTARVKETLRLFNLHYLHFVQEEEKRCKKTENGRACDDDSKRSSKRPDLKAISEMMSKKEILYLERQIGHLPGIEVGHQFFSRAEMVALGFHGHWLNGIDYIGQSYGKVTQFPGFEKSYVTKTDLSKRYKGYTFPLALAIVLSGQYEDDVDNSEEVVYTGQGGNDLLGNKRQVKDQEMIRGNLALKNNMEQSVPVRVVRGHRCDTSYSGKVYTYDGLYKVSHYWAEKGVAGFTVFKYRLKRLPGQPALITNQVHFTRGRGSKAQSELPGLVCKDISNGQENVCIPATNVIDIPPVAPEGFTYINSIQVSGNLSIPQDAPGCNCQGNCTNPKICSCAQFNGSDFPYVHRHGGRLIEASDVVFECGPNCGCEPGCINRTSQRGLKYRLEVYRTPNKGWAVRSWDSIPSGAPVCEYIGVLRRSDELESVSGNEFIFEIDCWQTINGIGRRERRLRDVSLPSKQSTMKDDKAETESTPEFCIDAGSLGNVARFINHSCEPNLFVQCVLSSHHDIRLARIVLFAADNIPPLQELTYDYGYELDSVIGSDGKIKRLSCYCGTAGCRKRLY